MNSKLINPCNKCIVQPACTKRDLCIPYYEYKTHWKSISPILQGVVFMILSLMVIFGWVLLCIHTDIVHNDNVNLYVFIYSVLTGSLHLYLFFKLTNIIKEKAE